MQSIGYVTFLVRDYDEALEFFIERLGFDLVEDTKLNDEGKRWILIAPAKSVEGGSRATLLLLAKAANDSQLSTIGKQAGGRVMFFLHTDNFWQDYHRYLARGIRFVREPSVEKYGIVAVFEDLYGNPWDLLQLTEVRK